MSNTTIWGHFEYKLLAGLDTAGSDNRELKSKLVEEVKKKPDPTEKDLDEFLQIVRDHESMIRAREHRETDDVRSLNRVTTATGVVEPGWPHRVCGKVHERGKCGYKCSTCGKPHKEEDCYTLHPEKIPKHWSKSPGKGNKSRGRDRSRDQQRGKNRSKSGERTGEKEKPRDRGQSPREMTGRVVEEGDDERELQQVEKLNDRIQKKNGTGANMKRVRNELFEENRREEENYMEDQRNWSRNERENGQRRLRRIVTGTVPPSGGTPVNQHLVAPQLEGRTINSSIQEAVGSYRTKISLEVPEDSEMVGSGDFQGAYKTDLDSQYRKLSGESKMG